MPPTIDGTAEKYLLLTAYKAAPSSDAEIQAFLDSAIPLQKPLVFAKTESFVSYSSCLAWTKVLATLGYGCCIWPTSLFCPRKVTDEFDLKLDQHVIAFHSANNDCCCHVAASQKTVPLDKVQDVQLQEGCCETCFSLKKVEVQTAGNSDPVGGPEIVAAFLKNPEMAREAIQLAVKLNRLHVIRPPAAWDGAPTPQGPMHRTPLTTAGPGPMQQRLARLNRLAQQGVLAAAELDSIRPGVLAAATDLTLQLEEAHELLRQELLSEGDYAKVKQALMKQAMAV